ncbi:XtrA/YqaO family protein [Planococcus sp. YIM B11945]|uniref:XtrA/YqaO family protein n=1 Tax=Planococcus sp. YIM B11945 TaxID=3435410 RepID=UPI003D7D4B7C
MNYYLFEANDFELNLVFVEEELQTFRELWENDISLKKIAKQMRRHPSEIALLVFDHAERELIRERQQGLHGHEGGAFMRMEPVIISETGELKLDIMELPESCVLIISHGKAKIAPLPKHAETSIVTHDGKVSRVRFDEGEVF